MKTAHDETTVNRSFTFPHHRHEVLLELFLGEGLGRIVAVLEHGVDLLAERGHLLRVLHLDPDRADFAAVAVGMLEVLHREEERSGVDRVEKRAPDGQFRIEGEDLPFEGDTVTDLPAESLHQRLSHEGAAAIGQEVSPLLRVDFVVVPDHRHLFTVDCEVRKEVRLFLVVGADPLQLGHFHHTRKLTDFLLV